jgi:hypothetical protein
MTPTKLTLTNRTRIHAFLKAHPEPGPARELPRNPVREVGEEARLRIVRDALLGKPRILPADPVEALFAQGVWQSVDEQPGALIIPLD